VAGVGIDDRFWEPISDAEATGTTLLTASLVAACGARGPLDDTGPLDGATTADVDMVDAATAAECLC